MGELEREIETLAERWYLALLDRPYRDRDCHWLIESQWSYGSPPGHVVVHQGDIYGRIEEEYATRGEALSALRGHLVAALERLPQVDRPPWGDEDSTDCGGYGDGGLAG